MNVSQQLSEIGLSSSNSVVIGSGILDALGIRKSSDIDVAVNAQTYARLASDKRFRHTADHGEDVLTAGPYDVRQHWVRQSYEDLFQTSVIIEGVRYISLEFLLEVKKSWLKDDHVRQKDIDDVALIEGYLNAKS